MYLHQNQAPLDISRIRQGIGHEPRCSLSDGLKAWQQVSNLEEFLDPPAGACRVYCTLGDVLRAFPLNDTRACTGRMVCDATQRTVE